MEIIKFMYEHWLLTSWFLFLIRGTEIIKFTKTVNQSLRNKNKESDN